VFVRWIRAMVVVLIAAALSLSAAAAGGASPLRALEIATGSVGGAFHLVGAAVARELESALRIPVTAAVTQGSAENVRLLDRGSVELAIIASNAIWPAWKGEHPYQERSYRNMRLVMYLYPNPTVFYALRSSGISKIRELKGRRVGVGTAPATWDHLTGAFLAAHGLDYSKDIRKVYGSFDALARQVGDGLLDAAIGTASGGILIPAIQELALQKPLNFLEWDEAAIKKLSTEYPYFFPATVPGRNLPGYAAGRDYATVDLGGPYLVARADLPVNVVYRITEVIYKRLKELSEQVSYLKGVAGDPRLLTSRLGDIPFHPGAERFWRDVGLWGR